MGMEPSPPEVPFNDAMYQVQLINLGRILENPEIINDFITEDFADMELKWVTRELKSDKLKEAKNEILKSFMARRGLLNWGEGTSGVRKELFDTQRRQTTIENAALQACILIDNIKAFGSSANKQDVLSAVEKLKGLLE